jgi:hypothetical protein
MQGWRGAEIEPLVPLVPLTTWKKIMFITSKVNNKLNKFTSRRAVLLTKNNLLMTTSWG